MYWMYWLSWKLNYVYYVGNRNAEKYIMLQRAQKRLTMFSFGDADKASACKSYVTMLGT